ncbi:MAG: calcium-binding protein, partial [Minisyncoccia bacterium]
STEGIDTISDFTLADNDVINVSATGFLGGLVVGTLLATQFRSGAGVTSANNATQRFIYNTTDGALRFDVDGNGATAAIQIATLSNLASIANTNIVVI